MCVFDLELWLIIIIFLSSEVYHNVEMSDPSPARPVAGLTSAPSAALGGLRPFGVSCPPHLAGMERCDVDLVVVGLDRFRLVIFGAYCVHGLTGPFVCFVHALRVLRSNLFGKISREGEEREAVDFEGKSPAAIPALDLLIHILGSERCGIAGIAAQPV